MSIIEGEQHKFVDIIHMYCMFFTDNILKDSIGHRWHCHFVLLIMCVDLKFVFKLFSIRLFFDCIILKQHIIFVYNQFV